MAPLFVALLATSLPAAAQSADELIDEGVRLRGQGDDARALEVFERAYRLEPSPRALAQRALAEQALGRWVDAEAHLMGALAGDDRWVAGRRRVLDEALVEIRSHLGRLIVETNVSTGELYADGHPIARLPLDDAVRLPAGTVEIELRSPGHRSARRSVVIRANETSRETLELASDAVQAAETSSDPWPAITVLSFAGALAVGAVVAGIWWADRIAEHDICEGRVCRTTTSSRASSSPRASPRSPRRRSRSASAPSASASCSRCSRAPGGGSTTSAGVSRYARQVPIVQLPLQH
jgi:hypothetical protein